MCTYVNILWKNYCSISVFDAKLKTKQTGAKIPRGYANRPAEFILSLRDIEILLRLCYNIVYMINKEQPSQLSFDGFESQHDYGGQFTSGDTGHEYPFVIAGEDTKTTEQEDSVSRGVAVDLGARARALMTIMDFYAYHNRTEGMKKQSRNPQSDFRRRYGRKSERIVRGALANDREKLEKYHQALRVLYPKDEMVAAGLADEADVDIGYTSFKKQLNDTYSGSGREENKWRQELMERIRSSTEIMGIAQGESPMQDHTYEDVTHVVDAYETEEARAERERQEKETMIRMSGDWQEALDHGDVARADKLWIDLENYRRELGYGSSASSGESE